MGPRKAARTFLERTRDRASRYTCTLYGALAATGRGHLTDQAILTVLTEAAPTEIIWKPETVLPFHTNGMKFEAFDQEGKPVDQWTVYSIGGGDIVEEGQERTTGPSIYPLTKIKDIQRQCEKEGTSYWEYVEKYEGSGIWDYLEEVWKTMQAAVERGIEAEGVLPGSVGVRAITSMPRAMPSR